MRRHWFVVGAGMSTILILAIVATRAIQVAHRQEQELLGYAARQLITSTGTSHTYDAVAIAGKVAAQLNEQRASVAALAVEPDIVRILAEARTETGKGSTARKHAHSWVEARRREKGFENLWLFSTTGQAIVITPTPSTDAFFARDYSWRDYFLGAKRQAERLERSGYISLAFQAEVDGGYRYGVAVPVYDGRGSWIGVVMATRPTDAALAELGIDAERADAAKGMVVVVAPRDKERNDDRIKNTYVVVAHEGLEPGTGVPIDAPELQLSRARRDCQAPSELDAAHIVSDAHRDPVRGFEGRWIAARAPVVGTCFVVIVQSRYDPVADLSAPHL